MKKLVMILAITLIFLTAGPALTQAANAKRVEQIQTISVHLELIRKSTLLLRFNKLNDVTRIDYVLTYTANGVPQGVVGSVIPPHRRNNATRQIFLGTCSQNSCIKHDAKNINLEVTTKYKNGQTITTTYTLK